MSDALKFLDHEPDPKTVPGGMAIVENEERPRRQAPRDGMLEGDGDRFDKRKHWKPENVGGPTQGETPGCRPS